MTRPWEGAIHRLRRRARRAATIEGLGRFAMPAAPLAVAYFALTRVSPWARFFAPYVGAAAGLALIVFAVVARVRARRSDDYYAKWIDRESRLDDRLTSSVEWVRLAERDPYQTRCIEQLDLELAARRWRMVLPPVKARRRGLTGLALLALAAVVAAHAWQPRPVFEVDAHQKIALRAELLRAASEKSTALKAQVAPIADPELEQMANDLGQVIERLGEGKTDKERSLADLARLSDRVASLQQRSGVDRLAAIGSAGAVGALARAVSTGDAKASAAALAQLSAALAEGGLSDDQLDELGPLLDELQGVAKGAGADPLAGALHDAAAKLRAGDEKGAAGALTAATGKLAPLEKPLAAIAAARSAAQAIANLQRAVSDRRPAGAAAPDEPTADPKGVAQRDPAQGDDPPSLSTGLGVSDQGDQVGASNATTSHDNSDRAPADAPKGPDVQVRGIWNGKVVRQLFQNQRGADAATDDAKRMLVEHARVVEDRFRRDDVPPEYQDAVRAYFAALHEREKKWTQTSP